MRMRAREGEERRIFARVHVHPEGKYVCDMDKHRCDEIDARDAVALRNDSSRFTSSCRRTSTRYVSLKVEKVPDSTFDMIGGLVNR